MSVSETWIKTCQCYNGSRLRHDGLAAWWADPRGIRNLLERMERYHELGYRTQMLVLPGGTVSHPMRHDQWDRLGWMMPGRQEELAEALIDWRVRHSDSHVMVYMGWPPGPREMIREVAAWVGCTIEGFGMDWATNSPASIAMARRYHDALGRVGIDVIGEAVPDHPEDRKAMPWFGLAHYHHKRDPGRTWRGVGVGVRGSRGFTPTHESLVDHLVRGNWFVIYGDDDRWHDKAMAARKEAVIHRRD